MAAQKWLSQMFQCLSASGGYTVLCVDRVGRFSGGFGLVLYDTFFFFSFAVIVALGVLLLLSNLNFATSE